MSIVFYYHCYQQLYSIYVSTTNKILSNKYIEILIWYFILITNMYFVIIVIMTLPNFLKAQ